MTVTTIHLSRSKSRKKLEFGDRKIIKGQLHERRMARTACGAFNCTGGRQNVVWVPVNEDDEPNPLNFKEL